jgi:hypothetical protein
VKKLLVLVLFGSGVIRAQLFDSLQEILTRHKSIDARIESRNSFINNQLISVSGVRLGVAFQRRFRIGGGLSWLNSAWSDNEFQTGSDVSAQYLKFAYLCWYVDFVFHKTKRWQLSVPIQVGTGLAWYQPENRFRWEPSDSKNFLILYEPGITIQYKIFRWFGLGADVAYRFAAVKKFGDKLNSPTYSLKVMIWFDQLYYLMFPASKLANKYGPASW